MIPFDRQLLAAIHSHLQYTYRNEEPIPDFTEAELEMLDYIASIPDVMFFGKELYSSPAQKASALLYSIIKDHYFQNGNKRMAVLCTATFLYVRHHMQVTASMTELALEVAESGAHDSIEMKVRITKWFEENSRTLSEDELPLALR